MTIALVTGAAKRLGRTLALTLAEQGHDVAVHYASSADAAATVADEIRAMGRKAVTLQADLLHDKETETLIPRAVKALGGPVRVLVNNASIFEHDSLPTATRDSWDRHMQSNLRAPFMLTQALAAGAPDPQMDAQGEPVAQALVVNMIDQRVRKLTPEFMSYTLAKSALWTLTQTSAQALAPRVRVNGISPGPTLRSTHQSEDIFRAQRAATILQRGAGEADIAQALSYLLTARSVTGQMICVDGGQHLGWQTPDLRDLS